MHLYAHIHTVRIWHIIRVNSVYENSGLQQSTCSVGDLGLTPGSGRSPGEGNGYPPQYSCWRSPWTEESGRLQSVGSQRVTHD